MALLITESLTLELAIGGTSVRYSIDSDRPEYVQQGEPLDFHIQELLGIDYEAAIAVVEQLATQDAADVGSGLLFDKAELYVRSEVDEWIFHHNWDTLAATLKHGQRFFSTEVKSRLAHLFGDHGSKLAAALPTYVLGDTGDSNRVIFRARRATSVGEARQFIADPCRELSAPPPAIATASRMNASGISVFYGALETETAIAEVRPSVGGFVVVASFEPTRPLRLLDLTSIHDISTTDSIFAPDYRENVARRQFLQSFHRLIAQPIQPHEEALEYLPTQAVSEYVRNVLRFDGILFASAQVGALNGTTPDGSDESSALHSRCNVVLFGVQEVEYDFDRISPLITAVRMDFPVRLLPDTVQGHLISHVAYSSFSVNLDDERGE